MTKFDEIVITVGTLYVCYWLFKCLKFVWQVLKTTFLGRNIDFTRFGEWAGTCFDVYLLYFTYFYCG
jgi:hypothetical protein